MDFYLGSFWSDPLEVGFDLGMEIVFNFSNCWPSMAFIDNQLGRIMSLSSYIFLPQGSIWCYSKYDFVNDLTNMWDVTVAQML